MNHLEVLEKIIDNLADSLEYGTATYIYSAAIYDSWSNGSDLEKNMAGRLVTMWIDELDNIMTNTYHSESLKDATLDRSDFCCHWVDGMRITHSTHKGLLKALEEFCGTDSIYYKKK
jgi:hypothetical protein